MPSSSRDLALLIDANALIHRAWHALPPLTAPDGRLVNAVYGFSSVLLNIVAELRPTYLAVCWDTPEPTYRHKANADYKAHREEQPDEFYAQMPIAKEIVNAYGGLNVELPGYEADDLLATLATQLADKKTDVIILTSDRDTWQLISPSIKIMSFKKGVSETLTIDQDRLFEDTGLTPEQIPDYKAMRGDPSDNLKGVPGIGDKTATELLKIHGTLEGILKAAHDSSSNLSASVRRKLLDGEKSARETLPLVVLVKDAPLSFSWEDTKRRPVDEQELRRLFTALGFKSLLTRLFGKMKEEIEPKKASPLSSSKVLKQQTTRPDPVSFLGHIVQEGQIILQPVQTTQASLFSGLPGVALASRDEVLIVSREQLQQQDFKKRLSEILENEKIGKIGHNLKQACHWAHGYGFDLRGLAFDTEIAACLVAAGEGGHDLESLAANRLKMMLPQTDERPIHEVEAIRMLLPVLTADLEDQKLTMIFERFEMPLILILAEMERSGILIDRPYFNSLTEDFRREKAKLEKEMEKLAGDSFNPGSPQQLAHILFEVLKLPTKGIKRGKTGISTAASELEKLEGTHPIVGKISEYREVAKLLSTYVEALPALADKNNRVHTTYNQLGAATGRMSSSNPNLQNIPIRTELGRKIRRGFIAEPGFYLVSCDYSQIELRVIAALSKDRKMIEAFEQGLDIHTATAASIWKIPLDEVSKDQRRAAKAINFGIVYGQGPHALAKGAGISFEEAKKFIDDYFYVYSGVREYIDQTKALAHARGYVETLFGRRRPISDINSPLPQLRAAAERMAINMPVQGTATADLMKLAMVEVSKQLPRLSSRSRLLLQVHDELVFEVPEDEVHHLAPQLIGIMQNVEKIGVPIVVEAKFGKNWEEMKKIET